MTEQPTYLFAYGLLMSNMEPRPGRPNRPDISTWFEFVTASTINADLLDTGLGYPGVVPSDSVVIGELWRVVDPAGLDFLDAYERYDRTDPESSEYVRSYVHCVDATDGEAHVYWYNFDTSAMSVVDHGDWRRYVSEQTSS